MRLTPSGNGSAHREPADSPGLPISKKFDHHIAVKQMPTLIIIDICMRLQRNINELANSVSTQLKAKPLPVTEIRERLEWATMRLYYGGCFGERQFAVDCVVRASITF